MSDTAVIPAQRSAQKSAQATAADRDRTTAVSPGLTLLALAAAGLVVSLQQTLVLPLLPRLMTEFDASVASISWVFTATLLAGAVATPLLSRFGDMYGKKRMISLTMVLLVAGSVVCALADSLEVMIAGRALQGAAAAVIPLAIGIIRDTVPREKVTSSIGIVSATMGVGGALGMLVSGVVSDNTDTHRPIFWISAGMAVLGLVFIRLFTRESGIRTGGRPDLFGAFLLAEWLVFGLLAISKGNEWGWTDTKTVGLLVGAVGVAAFWVKVEKKVREPLVQIDLLAGARSLSANAAGLLLGFAMFASFALVSTFIQSSKDQLGYGLDGSLLDVGLYMLPSTVTMLAFSTLAGRFEARLGAARTLGIGSLITASSYVWLAVQHDTALEFMIFSAVQGIGIGLAYATLGTLAVQHVPMEQSGIASGVNTLVRSIGGSVASAATSAILAGTVLATTGAPTETAYVVCFLIAAAAAALAAVVAAVNAAKYRAAA